MKEHKLRVKLKATVSSLGDYAVYDLGDYLIGYTDKQDKLMYAKDGCAFSKAIDIIAVEIDEECWS